MNYLLAGGTKEKLEQRGHNAPDERADTVRRRAHDGPHRSPQPWNGRAFLSADFRVACRGERRRTRTPSLVQRGHGGYLCVMEDHQVLVTV